MNSYCQKLNAAGRHVEEQLLLDQIIKDPSSNLQGPGIKI